MDMPTTFNFLATGKPEGTIEFKQAESPSTDGKVKVWIHAIVPDDRALEYVRICEIARLEGDERTANGVAVFVSIETFSACKRSSKCVKL